MKAYICQFKTEQGEGTVVIVALNTRRAFELLEGFVNEPLTELNMRRADFVIQR